MKRRRIRPLVIGRDGAGKSWFVATFPKKMLVFLFDAPDKADAYLRRGTAKEIQKGRYCYFQEVFSEKDPERLIIRLEYWGESSPNNPTSYLRFVSRTAGLDKEIVEEGYETVVLDSTTAFELVARYYSQYNLHKFNAKGDVTADDRLHYRFSAHAAEQFIMTRWPNLIMTNAVVIGHYGEAKTDSEDGEMVTSIRTVELPGKIAGKVGTQFSEVWRVYVDAEGNRRLQTGARARNNFACKTAIGVADGIYPHYEALWPKEEDLGEVLPNGKSGLTMKVEEGA